MINFMCLLGGCFWVRLTSKLVNFWCSRLSFILWVGLIQAVEGLSRIQRLSSPGKGEFSWQTAFGLHLHHQLFWVSSLPAHTADFGLASLHNRGIILFTINKPPLSLSPSLSLSLSSPPLLSPSPTGSVSIENSD